MARTKICAELATGHHGDVSVALQMIQAAADAGCDAVKIQHYSGHVNLDDPQAMWLIESRLTSLDVLTLRDLARKLSIEFWATPFDRFALDQLVEWDVDRIKIASTEVRNSWHQPVSFTRACVLSWPWGDLPSDGISYNGTIHLTAIPLYPTPLECVYRAPLLDGWSDHTVGLAACQYMISQGAQWIEAHLTLGEGKSRVCVWDKHPDDFRKLRQFADDVETMRTGVSQVFRDRWRA
jgi:sialic acid synthase SpsE